MTHSDADNVQLLNEDYARADRDLGQQGLPGSLLYAGIWLLFMGVTSLPQDLPVVAWTGLVLVTIPGAIRLALGIWFDRVYPANPKRWLTLYSVVVIWLAAAWGLLLAILVWYYQATWPAMIAGFATAGIVAGGTISLNTHKRLQQSYVVILLLPPALAGLASGDQLAIVMGILFLADMLFLIMIGLKLDRSYWSNIRNLRLVKTHAQELEQARRKAESADRAKGQFVAKVSHELRTPLNGLIGTLDMLRHVDSPAKRERYLEIMHKSAHLLLQRINEILDFSKMGAGKLVLESIPFDPAQVVRDSASLMQDSAAARGLELRVDIRTRLERALIGDPTRINQVLLNLLSNAIKFTPHGTIVIAFEQADTNDGRGHYAFSVSDSGIGIPPAAQEHIFDSFSQADDSTTRQYGGTGLGLAVSRDFAVLMGGRLGVDSEPGKGSCFTLTLPLELSDERLIDVAVSHQLAAPEQSADERAHSGPPESDTPAMARNAGDAAPANGHLGLHVLVAEDNPVNQFITCEMLTALGCTSDVAGDGLSCVECYRDTAYDLVLMDCDMPGLDGCEAATEIHSRNREQQQPPVPIIAVTAHDNADYRQRAVDAGIADFITKPFTLDDLQGVLHAVARTRPSV